MSLSSPSSNKQNPPVSGAALDFRLLFTLQKIIQSTCNTGSTVKGMEPISGHIHCIRYIYLSNGTRVVLKTSLSTGTGLLRFERHALAAEASAYSLLDKSKLPIPRVLKYDPKGVPIGSQFLLTTHLPGVTYASVRPYLTRSERSGIERQLQSLSSIINQHTSPRFGPVGLDHGYSTWREAFMAVLESILMDGEDKLVSLPYSQIRDEVIRFGKVLDEIRQARLVVLGFGQPENVLVDRKTNEVTGLTDFGRALWADPEMGDGGARSSPRSLL
ncbi:hypothetical protein G7Y79_00016g041300 [Physcia stellaris]|nr:hypothetical protein G7Y79_00016g041300 [Physcia stellaris]